VLAPQVTTRITLRNILLATDFSHTSEAALAYATGLAKLYGAKIFMVHAVEAGPYLSLPLEPIPMDFDVFWNDAQNRMKDFAAANSFGAVAHEEILQRGEVWDVISEVVKKKNVDLLVVGTHGRHGLTKLVLGSEAEKIYRQAECPVLTVGPGVAHFTGKSWKLKSVLFPTDFSETSLNALPHALSLAEENGATLIVAHMVPMVPWQEKVSVERAMRKRLQALLPPSFSGKVDFLVGFDFPAEGILNLAQNRDANLIVMGVSHPASVTWKAHLPGSVASEVVATAHCPVLTVRG
jgi:nucleotide-binding universal stress UspA family protein